MPSPATLPAQIAHQMIDLEAMKEMCYSTDFELWAEHRLGLTMADLHREWCQLRQFSKLLCVVAPREHSKSETFTVNGTAWEAIYNQGIYSFIFAATDTLASELLLRTKTVIEAVQPGLVRNAVVDNDSELILANHSRIRCAGAGKSIRGAHPDRIIGDDVLEESKCYTDLQRRRTISWWNGTVANMKHPGTHRRFSNGVVKWFEPTRTFLVGTPFHKADLLMGMRDNPMYEFRRYAAEFDPGRLVPGTLAVEIG